MDEKGKVYQYVLKLSFENPVENKLIQAIRERDRLEYPSVKLFILKKILQSTGITLADSQRIKELEQDQQQLKELVGQLIQEVEDIKPAKRADVEAKKHSQVSEQQTKEQPEVLEESKESYAVNDLDDDFAAGFLENYDI